MKGTFLAILLLFSVALFGQNKEFVKDQISILASDSLAGRGYVQNGMTRAAQYIATQYEEAGLTPVADSYFQSFAYSVNTFPKQVLLKLNSHILQPGADYLVAPESGSDTGTFQIRVPDSTEVVENKIELKPDEVAVLPVYDLKPEIYHHFIERVLQTNPVIERVPSRLIWSVGRGYYPHAWLQVADSSWIDSAKTIDIQIENQFNPGFAANNVVGLLPGQNSDSTVVFTAHYDHLGMMGSALFAGASDNASGVGMLLDLAHYYSLHKPDYNVMFIAFAGEEAGLIGSKYFVEHPLVDLSAIKLLINLDLMGSAADGITVVNGKLYPDLMARLQALNEEHQYLPRVKLRGEAANSDHYWFSEAGVPAVFIYTLGNITAYHDIYDLPAGVDLANYDQLFRLLTEFVESL